MVKIFESDYVSNFYTGHKFSKIPSLLAQRLEDPCWNRFQLSGYIRWRGLERMIGLGDGEKLSWSGKKQALADRLNVSVRRGAAGGRQAFFTGKYAREQSPCLTGKTEAKQVSGGADRNFPLLETRGDRK